MWPPCVLIRIREAELLSCLSGVDVERVAAIFSVRQNPDRRGSRGYVVLLVGVNTELFQSSVLLGQVQSGITPFQR